MYILARGDASAHLVTSASQRLWTAFRPVTLHADTLSNNFSYSRKKRYRANQYYSDFLAFLYLVNLSLPQAATHHILAFMEFLQQ